MAQELLISFAIILLVEYHAYVKNISFSKTREVHFFA